jgi:hypothetical protein
LRSYDSSPRIPGPPPSPAGGPVQLPGRGQEGSRRAGPGRAHPRGGAERRNGRLGGAGPLRRLALPDLPQVLHGRSLCRGTRCPDPLRGKVGGDGRRWRVTPRPIRPSA